VWSQTPGRDSRTQLVINMVNNNSRLAPTFTLHPVCLWAEGTVMFSDLRNYTRQGRLHALRASLLVIYGIILSPKMGQNQIINFYYFYLETKTSYHGSSAM
jgi:hypothetical protein